MLLCRGPKLAYILTSNDSVGKNLSEAFSQRVCFVPEHAWIYAYIFTCQTAMKPSKGKVLELYSLPQSSITNCVHS